MKSHCILHGAGSFRWLCITALFACLAPFLPGQIPGPSSSLEGTVRDAQGQPVPYALVHLTREQTIRSTAIADVSGFFKFAFIAPGSYLVTAEAPLNHAKGASSAVLGRNQAKKLDVTLGPPNQDRTPSGAAMQFYDEPKFTVSGVTDTTSLGGHGSDTVTRTRDSLARETASLARTAAPAREEADRERDQVQTLLGQHPEDAQLHHRLADANEVLGNSLAAVHEYERAAELDVREDYVFDWGAELLLHHAPEPAAEVFRKGSSVFPKSERMLLGSGAADFALGSDAEAVQKMRAASELNSSDVVPYAFVAEMMRSEKIASAAAVEMMRRFAKLHPKSAEANYDYAVALWKSHGTSQGESRDKARNPALAQAESLLKKAIEIDPNFAAAYLQLGVVYADRKEFSQAIAEYQKTIELARIELTPPTGSGRAGFSAADCEMEAHFRLSGAYRLSGDSEKSQSELKTWKDLSAKLANRTEQERHDIPQFVYTLRDQPAAH